MMGEFDIDTLTIEQYLMLTQGNQAPGMVKSKFKGIKEKDIEDVTIVQYTKYEAEMNRQSWRNARSYFLTKYEDTDINSFHHDKSRVLDYLHHSDDSKINAYYDLPSLLPCFKHVQPHTKYRMINHMDGNKPFTPKPQPEDGELSSDKDLDDWLKTKIKKHMYGKDNKNEENALVAILKSLVGECKAVNANKGALTYQLPPKELKPGSFTLPSTIGNCNLNAMEDLGASVNVIPKSIFKHLKLTDLKEIDLLVEMADMTRKTPLGIVENILVEINKFLFPSDFVIMDMMGKPNETMILGRPFLAAIHAQINVFNREILLGIREDKVLLDVDGGLYHSKIPVEKVYMANSTPEEEHFNPLEIEDDIYFYKSHACLLFEQSTRSCDNESIDTFDSVKNV
uniref:Reverse transcriptase domain-containing protein n=1 Tax=Tanacetum cinerariifolium TaxID=118510 RepID=A0A6L2JG72_TANCI|nr:hypothetical protein [Tanacetum cinerariifolium]